MIFHFNLTELVGCCRRPQSSHRRWNGIDYKCQISSVASFFFLSVIKTKTKVLCLSSRAVTHRVDSYILRPRCTNYVRICRAPHLRVNFYWRGRHSADIIESAVCVAFCSRMLLVVCSPLPRACPLYEYDSVLSLLAVAIWRLVCICCVIRCNCNQAGWINRCYVWILSTRPVPVCDCIRHLDVQTQTIYTFIHSYTIGARVCVCVRCTFVRHYPGFVDQFT